MKVRHYGFTLIELMIVIAIISILAAIIIPNYIRSRSQAQLSACKSNIKNLSTAIEMYHVDNGVYPDNLDELINSSKQYIREIPICPSAGVITYLYQKIEDSHAPAGKQDSYQINCKGTNHAACNIPEDFPMYTGGGGLKEQ